MRETAPKNQPESEDPHAFVAKMRKQLLTVARKGGRKFKNAIALRLSLTPETDRSCAVMGTSYIDQQLVKLLKAYFVSDRKLKDLFNHSGPLGTFSSRIDLAYAVGLISSDLRKEIHVLRKIRNEFAHEHKALSFDSSEIKMKFKQLSVSPYLPTESPRRLFLTTLMLILATLDVKIGRARHRRAIKENPSEKRKQLVSEMAKELESPKSS